MSKADVFSVTLNCVAFSVEASHAFHRVVTFETDTLKLQNAVNKVEHESVAACHAYIKSLEEKEIRSNIEHDRIQLEKEQGI